VRRFTPEQKLKAVRLRVEQGFSARDICAEFGVAQSGLSRWLIQYRQHGEAGLQNRVPSNICSGRFLELNVEVPGILKHGQIGATSAERARNTFTSWGDYFFMEALARETCNGFVLFW
jgi:transposase-like protein